MLSNLSLRSGEVFRRAGPASVLRPTSTGPAHRPCGLSGPSPPPAPRPTRPPPPAPPQPNLLPGTCSSLCCPLPGPQSPVSMSLQPSSPLGPQITGCSAVPRPSCSLTAVASVAHTGQPPPAPTPLPVLRAPCSAPAIPHVCLAHGAPAHPRTVACPRERRPAVRVKGLPGEAWPSDRRRGRGWPPRTHVRPSAPRVPAGLSLCTSVLISSREDAVTLARGHPRGLASPQSPP